MRRFRRSQLLITTAILLVIFLIPLIPGPEFHDGIPLNRESFTSGDNRGSLIQSLFEIVQENIFWNTEEGYSPAQRFLSLIGIPISIFVLLLLVIGLLISGEIRKKIMLNLLAGFSVFFILYLLFFSTFNKEVQTPVIADVITTGGDNYNIGEDEILSEIEDEMDPQISKGISYIFSIVILLLLSGFVYFLYRKILIINKNNRKTTIKEVTEKALNSIYEGSDIPDIIIRCYNDMVICLQKEMGIIRSVSMTPSEFKSQLMRKGLPEKDLEQLTALFERVRYGKSSLSDVEEQKAESCLKSVVLSLEKRK